MFPVTVPADVTVPSGYRSRQDPDIQRALVNFHQARTQAGWNADEIPSDELRVKWEALYTAAKVYLVEFGTFLNGFFSLVGQESCNQFRASDVLEKLAGSETRLLSTFYESEWTKELICEMAYFFQNEPRTLHQRFLFAEMMEVLVKHIEIRTPVYYAHKLTEKYHRMFDDNELKFFSIPIPSSHSLETGHILVNFETQKMEVHAKQWLLEQAIREYRAEETSFRADMNSYFRLGSDFTSKH